MIFSLFFFNDTATTEIYTLSLHDALPISEAAGRGAQVDGAALGVLRPGQQQLGDGMQAEPGRDPRVVHDSIIDQDRKSTRLNSSHANISYAVFCLKKNNKCHSI